MRVLVTGANGFVGRHLAGRLLADAAVNGRAVSQLILMDVDFAEPPQDSRVRLIKGSIAEAKRLCEAFSEGPVDLVFHLASIPGGLAEAEFSLGLEVNLYATQQLLELLRQQQGVARLVFASTIAVYGAPMPAEVTDDTPLRPCLSYAAQKLIGEVLVDDYSRRGWIDGVSLRLPGIVARPPEPSGLLSAFMSDVFWRLKAGEHFICPVSPKAVAWWMSVSCCVDNLLHAATVPTEALAARRSMALPVLRLTMAEVVKGLARRFGADRFDKVDYRPDAKLEVVFGALPPLHAKAAETLGFRHDGDVDQLIERAIVR